MNECFPASTSEQSSVETFLQSDLTKRPEPPVDHHIIAMDDGANFTDGKERIGLEQHAAIARSFTLRLKSPAKEIHMEWKNISFDMLAKSTSSSLLHKKYDRKRILKSVCGIARSSELLAIMGPTGCGKTSLLSVLSARAPLGGGKFAKLDGQILVNGKPRDDEKFRRLSAYVLQDDKLFPHLTVYETLLTSAHFYLPSSVADEEKVSTVEAIIGELGLAKARDTIIGDDSIRGVSGGERRRANIAVQLICNPAVLFLDEPTSGLDSFQAQSVMEAMKAMAMNNRLVISVIHQPRSSIFSMFDRLLLLSEGQTMYFGPAEEAVAYFEQAGYPCPNQFNPSDFFLDLLSPDHRDGEVEAMSSGRIKQLGEMFLSLPTTEVVAKVYDDLENIGLEDSSDVYNWKRLLRNFRILCWRSFSEQIRERSARAYETLPYFAAKFFVEIPLNSAPTLLFGIIIYQLVGLNYHTFGYFLLILMFLNITSITFGLFISAISPSVESARGLATPIIIILVLFGGFYINIGSLPPVANLIPYLSFIRWTFAALCINEFVGEQFNCGTSTEKACQATGEQVLDGLGFGGQTPAPSVFGLAMVFVGLLVLVYTVLEFSRIKYMPLGYEGSGYERFGAQASVVGEEEKEEGAKYGSLPSRSEEVQESPALPV